MVSILGFGKASGFVVDRHTWGGCETSYHVPCMLTSSAKCSNVAVLHMIHSLERGAEVKVSFFCLDNSVFALTKEWDGGNNSEDRRSPPKISCIIYVMFFLLILMSLVLCTLCLVSGAATVIWTVRDSPVSSNSNSSIHANLGRDGISHQTRDCSNLGKSTR